MTREEHLVRAYLLCAALAVALLSPNELGAGVGDAPAASFRAVPLLRTAVSGDASREAIIARGEFPPGATTGPHTHPGDEYAYVIAGTLELLAEGHPPRRVRAGEAYHNPRGLVHETRNVGDDTARVVSTFIIEKGRPIIEPVPAKSR